jgi:hypothetical protein
MSLGQGLGPYMGATLYSWDSEHLALHFCTPGFHMLLLGCFGVLSCFRLDPRLQCCVCHTQFSPGVFGFVYSHLRDTHAPGVCPPDVGLAC